MRGSRCKNIKGQNWKRIKIKKDQGIPGYGHGSGGPVGFGYGKEECYIRLD